MNKNERYIFYGIIGAFLLLFLCWLIGWVCNGLLGTKFDLNSCWAGFAAISGPGVLAMVKYIVDSLANSPRGISPAQVLLQGDDANEKRD